MFASSLACDADHDPTLAMIEAEREASGWWLRVVDDQQDLVTVDDDFDLAIVIDPVTLPKDITTGVGEGLAVIEVGGPTGEPLKIKLKITVLPAGPPAD